MLRNEDIKTPEGQFVQELRNDFGFTPIVAQAVLKSAKEKLGGLSPQGEQPKAGQMVVLAISADEPAGKPLSKCKFVNVIVTIDAGKEDLEVLQKIGTTGLRRAVLLRIATEAVRQKAYFTEEGVARILRCDVRTIKRDVRYYREQGIYVPLRGHMVNTGRGQTHKIMVVRWYVQGMTISEIVLRSCHSTEAITRYVNMFGRIVILLRRGLSIPAITQVVSITETLVEEYVKLYEELNKPEYQTQINRIVDRVKLPREPREEKKRRKK